MNRCIETFLIEELRGIGAMCKTGGEQHGDTSSLFAHEQAAFDDIGRRVKAHQLGEMLTNLEIHDAQSNRYFEVDLLVISSYGVFVTELKHWSGQIDIRPNAWLLNDSFYRTDPHKANSFKAKLFRGLYERQFPAYPHVYFESVVVLTNPLVTARGQSIAATTKNNPTFDSIDTFIQYLRRQKREKTAALSRAQCLRFSDYLKKLHTPGRPRDIVFPGYEIVERLYQYVDRAEVIARRTDIRHRKLCRLRIFYPPSSALQADRLEAHERATNTLNAVTKIGEHPNILKVWDIPNEYGYIAEGSDWSETGTLRDVLDREGPFTPERAVAVAVGLLRGLHAAHEECVVHRSVSPENMLLVDGTPKLMNFDLSYQLEDERVTVIPDSGRLKRTPYIAPEVYAGGSTPEASADLFSVGVILYEMLVGKRPFDCSTDLERSGGTLTADHRRMLAEREVPENLTELVFELVQQTVSHRPSNAMLVLGRLEGGEETPSISIEQTNRQLAAGERCGLYDVVSFLHCGAESQIYAATGIGGRKILLKLFNRDVPRPRVVNEHHHSGAIHHPGITRVDSYGQFDDKRYYIAFERIEGRSLREVIDARERPGIEQFCSVARKTLDALEMLHDNVEDGRREPILHNDIKPENILLVNGDRPVLVDFGAASAPCVGIYEGTEGYVAPDLRLGDERQYCENGDLYALAVTLHEWLTGARPVDDDSRIPDVSAPLLRWFRKGSCPDAAKRFNSVKEMKTALTAAIEAGNAVDPVGREGPEASAVADRFEPSETERADLAAATISAPNPFMEYLNSMHSRSADTDNALAEHQAVNPFFAFIHVPHPLVGTIEATLLSAEKQHVVVTGHAGDGKSTIAVELYKRLTGIPIHQPLDVPLKPREDLVVKNTAISLIKDFSEWPRDAQADLLGEMLAPEGDRFFLISNTGTLLDAFKQRETARGDWMTIENSLLQRMENPMPSVLSFQGASFSIINIAMTDNLGMAEQIFRRMIAAERWKACDSASCREHCPIYRNVRLIRENLEIVIQRLFLAYRRIYEYGQRLTLRQLCAHLAYMLTSGLTYQDVIEISRRSSPPRITEFLFFNRFFGDSGRDVDGQAEQLRVIREIRNQGFGSQPCPTWERRLWLQSRDHPFQLEANLVPEEFDHLRKVGAGQRDDSITGPQAREQVRRAVFFLHRLDDEGGDRYVTSFLNSLMLLDFVGWQGRENVSLDLHERNSLRQRVLHVLQEHFTGVRLPEGIGADRHLYITLSRRSHDIRQSAQVVLARYPEDSFEIRLNTHHNPAGGQRRELLLIAETRNGPLPLALSLPFLDYVMMRNQGEVGQDLHASYVDRLERFKGQLIRCSASHGEDEIMLVRLRTNHTFRRQMFAVRNNRLEVSDG